jgi:hypothetical protein
VHILLELYECFILRWERKVSCGTPVGGYQDQKDFSQERVDLMRLDHSVNVSGNGLEVGLTRGIWAV